MFGIALRTTGTSEAQTAPRSSSAERPILRRGPVAGDADVLRSPSRWFGQRGFDPGDEHRRRSAAQVTRVGAPTAGDWRHAAVQLR